MVGDNMISGYTSAANVKGKLLPYEACILSMLNIADEVWVAFDSRYDVPETFTNIDTRVHVVEAEYRIEDVTGNGDQLSKARQKCTGKWTIWLDLDELIHEKDAPVILDLINTADTLGLNAVNLAEYNYVNRDKTFNKDGAKEWFVRHKITENIEGVIHGADSDAIIQAGDGSKYIVNGDGADYIKDGKFFVFKPLVYIDYVFMSKLCTGNAMPHDVLRTLSDYPYIYHYARYSIMRKAKMNSHIRNSCVWRQRKHTNADVEEWKAELGRSICLFPGDEDEGLKKRSILPLGESSPEHSFLVTSWVETIDTLLDWK
jgi:hypothetical protein